MKVLNAILASLLILVCVIFGGMYNSKVAACSDTSAQGYSEHLRLLVDIAKSKSYVERRIQWNIEVNRCMDRKTFPERRDCRRSLLKLIPVVPDFSERSLDMSSFDQHTIHSQNFEDYMVFGRDFENDASIDCSHCKL